jgi:hypothetical protein
MNDNRTSNSVAYLRRIAAVRREPAGNFLEGIPEAVTWAADEIERLEAHNAELRGFKWNYEGQIERLRADLANWQPLLIASDQLVGKLRTALRRIVEAADGSDSYDDLRRYARNALEGLPDETSEP